MLVSDAPLEAKQLELKLFGFVMYFIKSMTACSDDEIDKGSLT